MDIRTIIGFLVIVFISSLFNKNKNTAKPTTKSSEPMPSQIPKKKPSSHNETRTKSFSGGLEDLFKEIKAEYDKGFANIQKQEKYYPPEEDITEKHIDKIDQRVQDSKNTLKNKVKKVKGSVYEREIGKEQVSIDFNKESVIQGIIMSEILQKPKSLRR